MIYRKSLSSFDAISIRDVQCREQLSQIIKRDVYTVVDPVVLLGRSALLQRQKNIELGNKLYIFCYFLGNKVVHRKKAIEYAEQHGLEIKAVVNCGFDLRQIKIYKSMQYGMWIRINLYSVFRMRNLYLLIHSMQQLYQLYCIRILWFLKRTIIDLHRILESKSFLRSLV